MKHPRCAQTGHSIQKIRIWRESRSPAIPPWTHPISSGESQTQGLKSWGIFQVEKVDQLKNSGHLVKLLSCTQSLTYPGSRTHCPLPSPAHQPTLLPLSKSILSSYWHKTATDNVRSPSANTTCDSVMESPFQGSRVFPSINKKKIEIEIFLRTITVKLKWVTNLMFFFFF